MSEMMSEVGFIASLTEKMYRKSLILLVSAVGIEPTTL